MTELENKLLDGVQSLQSDMAEVKVTLARNTDSLQYHIKRTDTLQNMVDPVYKDYLARQAIEEYERKKKESLIYKLKLPVYIMGAITAVGTAIAWFVSK